MQTDHYGPRLPGETVHSDRRDGGPPAVRNLVPDVPVSHSPGRNFPHFPDKDVTDPTPVNRKEKEPMSGDRGPVS